MNDAELLVGSDVNVDLSIGADVSLDMHVDGGYKADLFVAVDSSANLEVADGAAANLEIGAEFIAVSAPVYRGAYEADALFSEQLFNTKNKRMVDDFTVHAINYTEAPNDSGVTLTIGG